MRPWALVAAAMGLCSCGALSNPRSDAGGLVDAGQSVARDAGTTTRADGGTINSVADSGNTAVDAGAVPDDGGFKATPLVVSPARAAQTITGLSGRGDSEFYAVTEHELLRSTGGELTPVRLPNIGTDPFLIGVYEASDGSVFILARSQIFTCRTGCAAGLTAFTAITPGSALVGVAICGRSPSEVSAVFEDGSSYHRAVLWQYAGTAWAQVSNDLGVGSPQACAVSATTGEVLVAGQGGIASFKSGASTVARPNLYPLSQLESERQYWSSVAVLGTEVWVGGDSLRTLQRKPSGDWVFRSRNEAVSNDITMAAMSPTEVYAGGSERDGTPLRTFNGTTWVSGPMPRSVSLPVSLFIAGPKLMFCGGSSTDHAAAVDRFTRD